MVLRAGLPFPQEIFMTISELSLITTLVGASPILAQRTINLLTNNKEYYRKFFRLKS
jgi:hypothetical protein